MRSLDTHPPSKVDAIRLHFRIILFCGDGALFLTPFRTPTVHCATPEGLRNEERTELQINGPHVLHTGHEASPSRAKTIKVLHGENRCVHRNKKARTWTSCGKRYVKKQSGGKRTSLRKALMRLCARFGFATLYSAHRAAKKISVRDALEFNFPNVQVHLGPRRR